MMIPGPQMTMPPPGAVLDYSHPHSRGLLGCWLFNEGAGLRTNDMTAYGRHGLHTASLWKPGLWGSCYQGDGSASHVDVGVWLDAPQMSVEVWCNTTTQVATAYVASHNDNATFFGWGMQVHGTASQYKFSALGGGTAGTAVSAFHFDTGNWHQIVGTSDGANARIYVDRVQGTPAAFAQSIGIFATPLLMRIGGRADSLAATTVYNGRIALVRIWNFALTQDIINALYQAPFDMFYLPSYLGWLPVAAASRIFRRTLDSRTGARGVPWT
jgi:hypothetical protein